ncbi:MAG: phage tail sheath family protein [Oscillospiraceae bacterium]|nr:phage tail sheath family protein [Oscillospiraceae bacterium]
MAEYLSPGVYVEEYESGSKPMEGVSTSVAGFIGMAVRGKTVGVPELVTSFADYQRKFGGYLSENSHGEYRYLPYSVEQFFQNGGSRCYIMRVAPVDAKVAHKEINKKIKFKASSQGEWGDKILISIVKSSKAKTQILEANQGEARYEFKSVAGFNDGDVVLFKDGSTEFYNKIKKIIGRSVEFETPFETDVIDKNLIPKKTIETCEISVIIRYDEVVEKYDNVSLNIKSPNYILSKLSKSDLVEVEVLSEKLESASIISQIYGEEADKFSFALTGGFDGTISATDASVYIGDDKGPSNRTGLQAFLDNSVVSMMAIPGVTNASVLVSLVAHCENLGSRMAILDIPKDMVKVSEIVDFRSMFDSTYSAIYHPWVQVYDKLEKKTSHIPPSGSVAGIYARSDVQRGVYKAPANETVACTGLSCLYNKGEQDILNPAGVNLLRAFPGQGIKVWGARTCSSDGALKYINVRRLLIFIEESIKANTNWAVFEPNNELLWMRVQRSITNFLTTLWGSGALAGASPAEAFFVDVSRNTMSPDDIANGRLICNIGVAPTRPAEFVIFKVTQLMGDECEGASAEE